MKQDYEIGNDFRKWVKSNDFLDQLLKTGMDENGRLDRPLREILFDFGYESYKAALVSESPAIPQQPQLEMPCESDFMAWCCEHSYNLGDAAVIYNYIARHIKRVR